MSASHAFFLGNNAQTYCTEAMQHWGDKAGRKEAVEKLKTWYFVGFSEQENLPGISSVLVKKW